MSITQTNTTLTITIPALPILQPYIPQLSTQTTLSIPLEGLKTSIRLVVIILTYILFRPHLERLFRTVTGREEKVDGLSVKERMEVLKAQQQQQGQKGQKTVVGKKSYAVATGAGNASVAGTGIAGKGSRRKA